MLTSVCFILTLMHKNMVMLMMFLFGSTVVIKSFWKVDYLILLVILIEILIFLSINTLFDLFCSG